MMNPLDLFNVNTSRKLNNLTTPQPLRLTWEIEKYFYNFTLKCQGQLISMGRPPLLQGEKEEERGKGEEKVGLGEEKKGEAVRGM